ncbi:MAG: SGNH/GDSL hydrolase family protein [Pseudomonadota bacterium]
MSILIRFCLILVAGFSLVVIAFASSKSDYEGTHLVRYKWVPVKAAISFDDPVKILFVGNSLTFGSDVPRRVEVLLNRRSDLSRPVLTGVVSFGGARLSQYRDHPTSNRALKHALSQTDWDLIVIQHQGLMQYYKSRREEFKAAVPWFTKIAPKGPRSVVLFHTWPYADPNTALRYGDPGYPETPADTVQRTQKLIYQVADRQLLTVAPVGPCWIAHPDLASFYEPDGIHSTPQGGQYAAEVIAQVLAIKILDDQGLPAPIFSCP